MSAQGPESQGTGSGLCPAGVPAKHRPRPRMRRGRCGIWPADTRPSTRRSPNSRETSAVSALGRTRRCWPPPVWALTQPRCCWSPPATPWANGLGSGLHGAVRRQAPVQASSGQTIRHRLNRGGNRKANSALWRIATTRMRTDSATKEYVTRRQAEGKNRKEIIRCLKRHIAREIYRLLTNPATNPELRPPARPPPERRCHHQPGRSSPPNPHRPHLRTRTRPPPQPPARHPIQTWLRTREPAPSPI